VKDSTGQEADNIQIMDVTVSLEVQLRHWFTTKEERDEEAIAILLERAQERATVGDHQSQYFLGEAYCLAGKHQDGIEPLEKAVCLSPLNADYIGALALAKWEIGEAAVAQKYLEICTILDPDNGQYDFHLGQLAERVKNTSKALDFYWAARSKLRSSPLPEYQRDFHRAGDAIHRIKNPQPWSLSFLPKTY
jgi:tetratricopeptide (TPR) repeat protein